jgi:hypothetical protein
MTDGTVMFRGLLCYYLCSAFRIYKQNVRYVYLNNSRRISGDDFIFSVHGYYFRPLKGLNSWSYILNEALRTRLAKYDILRLMYLLNDVFVISNIYLLRTTKYMNTIFAFLLSLFLIYKASESYGLTRLLCVCFLYLLIHNTWTTDSYKFRVISDLPESIFCTLLALKLMGGIYRHNDIYTAWRLHKPTFIF